MESFWVGPSIQTPPEPAPQKDLEPTPFSDHPPTRSVKPVMDIPFPKAEKIGGCIGFSLAGLFFLTIGAGMFYSGAINPVTYLGEPMSIIGRIFWITLGTVSATNGLILMGFPIGMEIVDRYASRRLPFKKSD